MDANRDEALRCLAIAKKKLQLGQVQVAKKFALKALKLYPSIDVSGLDSLIGRERSHSRERTFSAQNMDNQATRARQRSSGSTSEKEFTKPQADAVRKVMSCKDYYELLGVSKDTSEEDIRRAYKSLALKFHPDKNRAPGATEAFKKIGTAFNTLVDPEKRRRYDTCGTDEQAPRIANMHRHGDTFFQYDGDVFTMFFNGFPFSQTNRGTRFHYTRSRESEREANYTVYLQLIPLLLLFALSFFGNFFVKDPYYSLSRSDKYPVERHTGAHDMTYYVKRSFGADFDGNLHQLERNIEEDFILNLRLRCNRERDYRSNLIFHARYYGDEDGLNQAKNMKLHNCERLSAFTGA